MTYEVQIQSLQVRRYFIDAETEDEVRELYRRRGSTGIWQEADYMAPGDEDVQLLSIAEASDV